MVASCGHEMAVRLYRRESRTEMPERGRRKAARGYKGLTDGGRELWYCPKDEGGCGHILAPGEWSVVRR